MDALSSLSRLMRSGTGPGRTRADHPAVAAQLLAALARARQVRELSELIGTGALTDVDRAHLELADAFATELVDQGVDEIRSLDTTLARAWEVLTRLPRSALTMLPDDLLDAHEVR
jgi:V/A-type H+-transporting ATPase subunit B